MKTCSETSSVKRKSDDWPELDELCVTDGLSFASRKRACFGNEDPISSMTIQLLVNEQAENLEVVTWCAERYSAEFGEHGSPPLNLLRAS